MGLTYGDKSKMDKNGVPVGADTLLADLIVPIESILPVVVISNIDNDQLAQSLGAAGISSVDVGINN